MENLVTSSTRLGIVGGGQLGRMLALKAADWDIKIACLDKNDHPSIQIVCNDLQRGEMTSYDDVVAFGQKVDIVTVESDNVNADALEALEKQGKKTYPRGETLRIIQDKGLQRQFCEQQNLPVPKFQIFDSKEELAASEWKAPFIAKTCKAGYDGKGVFLIQEAEDVVALPEGKILAEEKVSLAKELTVMVARNNSDEVACFPIVELHVDSASYIVDYLTCPAMIEKQIEQEAQEIASKLIRAFGIEGVLAVEMFLDEQGNVWINECSPRPHNSGHHTIEGCLTSQYEQHLRAILNMPLGSCEAKGYSAMVNLLGEEGSSGDVVYEGLEDCMQMKGVKLHIYGKGKVAPNRKMGHVTILGDSPEELEQKVRQIKEKVKVKAS